MAGVAPRALAVREVDVLLVGGGVASVRCARTLRRHGFTGSILLVGDEASAPYNRPPLSKELLRGEVPDELVRVEPDRWYQRQGVELRTDLAVNELDAGARLAHLADGSVVRYRSCLLAPGAEPREPPIPGGEHAHLLRTVGDAATIRDAAVRAGAGGAAAVIGGGFIGVEVAASLAAHALQVRLFELSPRLWAGSLGATLSSWAVERLRSMGVDVRLSTAVTALEAGAVLVGDERWPTELIVAGVGVRPRTELAARAGLAVGDGIGVDARRRAAPGIFAAGDVAGVPHPAADGEPLRVEHWHAAREGGEAAAMGILGKPVPEPRAPWVYTEFAGQLIDVVGWAPRPDEERVIGDIGAGSFAVAALVEGRVRQVAVVNGALPIEEARAFVEARPAADALARLAPA
ncbi:MAG TPA: FAD-dependent oxidoreductase [Candidatus Limnocylindria bacterium]|nr:FAD-dependent oxidoreductase [Candidatus Limnocylindria bacterium]